MSLPLLNAKKQYFDQNGNPLAGGSVAFYIPGTLTPVNTYQDQALTILNSNPVTLDANGQAVAWVAEVTSVREIVKDSLANQIWDQVTAVGSSGTFSQGGTGSVPSTVTSKLQQYASVFDFGAQGNGTNNDLISFNNSQLAGKSVLVNSGTFNLNGTLNAPVGAWNIDPQARFTGPTIFNPQKGFYDDVKAGQVWRFPDRVRVGAAAGSVGALNWYAPNTYLLPQFGWQERDAALYAMSNGRLAISGVSQSSLNTGPFLGFVGTASISGNTMTVTAISSGGVTVGLNLAGTGVSGGSTVTGLGTGTGGIGTYTVSPSQTVASTTITGTQSQFFNGSIGVNGLSYNDGGVATYLGWGGYFEAARQPGSGATYGVEIDVGEFGGAFAPNPYNPPGSATIGLNINSGGSTGQTPTNPAGVALLIGSNPGTFFQGIVFANNALSASNQAISLAKQHRITWWNSSTQAAAYMTANISGAITKNITLTDTDTQIGNASVNTLFQFVDNGSNTNGIQFSSTATGQGKSFITSTGSVDANVDLYLQTKGIGSVAFGTYTAGAISCTGYIFIKDSGGTARRVMIG